MAFPNEDIPNNWIYCPYKINGFNLLGEENAFRNKTGRAVGISDNGTIVGSFRRGQVDGYAELRWTDEEWKGSYIKGKFREGKRHGDCECYFAYKHKNH